MDTGAAAQNRLAGLAGLFGYTGKHAAPTIFAVPQSKKISAIDNTAGVLFRKDAER